MQKKYNIAVAGATGLVGRTMLKVLEQRNFPVESIKLLSSARSAGTEMEFCGEKIIVEEMTKNSFEGVDMALFSAGGKASREFAPAAAEAGCVVIDNSSAWRMDSEVPLVVPEVNPDAAKNHKNIIANPNCSTIQLVVALEPIRRKFGLRRVVCSTYQSISGAGQKGLDKLNAELQGKEGDDKHNIAFNTMFHSVKDESGFTEEEAKMINETRKIMSLPDVKLAFTCVRLPILGGHGESVNLETEKPFTLEQIRSEFNKSKGLVLIDNMQNEEYPTPLMSYNRDEVFVGRLREDNSAENGLYMWVVADNLRKGAATNAVQIAELLIRENYLDGKN
jgi:aspartate-semialdehyde dehydrogenase